MNTQTKCERFLHAIPQGGSNYFLRPNLPQNSRKKIVAVIVPFFNEESTPLIKTIESLEICLRNVNEANNGEYLFVYLLIQDGYSKCSLSSRELIRRMFPTHREEFEALDDPKRDKGQPSTYIFQTITRTNDMEGSDFLAPTTIPDTNLSVPLALLVKKDNRKKHNSHEWFFSENGFCGTLQPKFCLATDCATLFKEDCIELLIKTMNDYPKCSVCTGRQVVMTEEQQRRPFQRVIAGSNAQNARNVQNEEETEEQDNLVEWIYRKAQCFDFESSFAVFSGAFALFGFLPVIPGPCGLYRWSDLKGEPLKWYFEIVNKPNEKCGIVLSNLKIAEDRILSYSVILKANRSTYMRVDSNAEFYFEAETSLEKFAKQRRRWINGTFAGYVYMMKNRHLIWESRMSFKRKLAVLFLIMCQTYIYCIVDITPAIFLGAQYAFINWYFDEAQYSDMIPTLIWFCYVLFYVAFAVAHAQTDFVGWMFYIQMFLGMVTILFSVGTSIFYLVTNWGVDYIVDLVLCLTFGVMVAPMLVSLHRPQSCWRAVKSCIPFWLFLPTLVAWFGCYAVSRFWDVSWGNRPSGPEETKKEEVKEDEPTNQEEREAQIRKKDIDDQLKQTQKTMMTQAKTYAGMVLLANFAILLLIIEKRKDPYYLLAMCLLVCSPAALQICVSEIYLIFNHLIERTIVKFVRWVLTKTIQRNQNSDGFIPLVEEQVVEEEIHSSCTPACAPTFPLWKTLMFSFLQLGINFGYQTVYLTIVPDMQLYAEATGTNTEPHVIGFPLLGFLSVLLGWIGDKYAAKRQSPGIFRGITVCGVILYAVATVLYFIIHKGTEALVIEKYYQLLALSYMQVVALNIVAPGHFVVLLRYVNQQAIMETVIMKAVLGSVGNLISAIVSLGIHFGKGLNEASFGPWLKASGITSCVLLGIGVLLLLVASDGNPEYHPDLQGQELRARNMAVILVSFCFLVAAISPVHFDMHSYFENYFDKARNTFLYSQFGLISQQLIVVIIALVVMYTCLRSYVEKVSVLLGLSVMLQLLFLTPIGSNAYVGLGIIIACGMYRTIAEVFSYYFFAREVWSDPNRTGLWVATMNVTLVIGQLLGYFLLSLAVQHLPTRYLFGFAAIFGVLGLSSTWRISRRKTAIIRSSQM